jgi:hypothetical protein
MDQGTKVYRAYTCMDQITYWIDEGVITGIVSHGQMLVRFNGVFVPLTERWHNTRVAAQADAADDLARRIGELQARLDDLRGEILHATLTQEAA